MDKTIRQQWAGMISKADPSPKEQEQRFHEAMNRRERARMSTGIPELDQALRGGLQAGLYVQENVTDVGGSAFLAQTARRLADSGTDVLYIAPAADPCEFITGGIADISLRHWMYASQSEPERALPHTIADIM